MLLRFFGEHDRLGRTGMSGLGPVGKRAAYPFGWVRRVLMHGLGGEGTAKGMSRNQRRKPSC